MDCPPQHWWILKVYLGAFAPWFRLLRSCWWLKSIPSGNPSIGWKKPYLFRWQMVLLRSFRSACSLKFNRSNKINKRFLFHRSDRWWPDLPALPGLRTSDRQTQVRAQGAMMGLENTFVPTLCQHVPTLTKWPLLSFDRLCPMREFLSRLHVCSMILDVLDWQIVELHLSMAHSRGMLWWSKYQRIFLQFFPSTTYSSKILSPNVP